jgi:hypothetical protein
MERSRHTSRGGEDLDGLLNCCSAPDKAQSARLPRQSRHAGLRARRLRSVREFRMAAGSARRNAWGEDGGLAVRAPRAQSATSKDATSAVRPGWAGQGSYGGRGKRQVHFGSAARHVCACRPWTLLIIQIGDSPLASPGQGVRMGATRLAPKFRAKKMCLPKFDGKLLLPKSAGNRSARSARVSRRLRYARIAAEEFAMTPWKTCRHGISYAPSSEGSRIPRVGKC